MTQNLSPVISEIVSMYGVSVLDDAQRVKALFADLARDAGKPQKAAFLACLDHGFAGALKNARGSTSDIAACKTELARRLHEEEGFDAALCGEAVETLAGAVAAKEKEMPKHSCATCGKELQEDWKTCPYCGAAVLGRGQSVRGSPGALTEKSSAKKGKPIGIFIAAALFIATAGAAVFYFVKPAKPAMVHIQGGTFWMGSTASDPDRFDDETQPPPPSPPPDPPPPPEERKLGGMTFFEIESLRRRGAQEAADRMAKIHFDSIPQERKDEYEIMNIIATSPERYPHQVFDQEVQHQVTVGSFYMSKYEVTQKEWQNVMGNNPSRFEGDDLPVEQVSWYDAIEYCNKRSAKEGLTPAYTIYNSGNIRIVTWNMNADGYRLPTEAEWEYACRAGTTTPFNTGNNITTSQAHYYGEKAIPVGSFAPNKWGLYDMHGNVSEWCWDWYGEYPNGARTNTAGALFGSGRVFRGGSWYGKGRFLRSAFRFGYTPSDWYDSLGFRTVRNAG